MKKNYFSDRLKINRSVMAYTGSNGKTYLAIAAGAGDFTEWSLVPVEKDVLSGIKKGDINLIDFLRENDTCVYKPMRSRRKIFRKNGRRIESVS